MQNWGRAGAPNAKKCIRNSKRCSRPRKLICKPETRHKSPFSRDGNIFIMGCRHRLHGQYHAPSRQDNAFLSAVTNHLTVPRMKAP
ncbi:hypothetical protein NPIL_556741 [Nephila pilipes]|uniref:Uncharacterized protein n=1 Tax=Nephila pilipes TaxID=299642 RepID=A0A8X6Q388_NEPPI|nr:hypothetical protein NPIL_556741 [Nephila pilipes]